MSPASIFPRRLPRNMVAAVPVAGNSYVDVRTTRNREPAVAHSRLVGDGLRLNPHRSSFVLGLPAAGSLSIALVMVLSRNLVHGALLLGLAVAIAPAAGVEASADLLTIKAASIGFGGKFKAGFWQPVRLTVVAGPEGARGRLELVVADGDQAPVVYRDDQRGQIDLNADGEQSVLLYAKSGPIAAAFTVRLVDEGMVVW